MTTITPERLSALQSQAVAAWATSVLDAAGLSCSNPTAFAAGQQYAADSMTCAELQAYADANEAQIAALLGTEVAPGVTYTMMSDLRSWRAGLYLPHCR